MVLRLPVETWVVLTQAGTRSGLGPMEKSKGLTSKNRCSGAEKDKL